MSVYILYCLTNSPYADLDPIPDAIVVKKIANGTEPSVARFYN